MVEMESNIYQKIVHILKTNAKIKALHDRIKIFGSVADGKSNPGDIDLMVDFSDYNGSTIFPPNECSILLSLARKYYGDIDIFVKVQNTLYCRNDYASGWELANHAKKIWKNSQLRNISIDDLPDNL